MQVFKFYVDHTIEHWNETLCSKIGCCMFSWFGWFRIHVKCHLSEIFFQFQLKPCFGIIIIHQIVKFLFILLVSTLEVFSFGLEDWSIKIDASDENATEPFAQPLGIVSKIPSTKHDDSLIYPPFSFFRLFIDLHCQCSSYIPIAQCCFAHTVWGVSCSQTSWMEHSYFILIPSNRINVLVAYGAS